MSCKTWSFEKKDWGILSFQEAYDRQFNLRQRRIAGEIPDQIIFLEHHPVITQGRQDCTQDFYHSKLWYEKHGIAICDAKRGGRLTYHGPGQLVVYFIVDLHELKIKVPDFVLSLEKQLIKILGDYGVIGELKCSSPGVFVRGKKIASIGLSVDRGVTMHGISINLNNPLDVFGTFKACGEGDATSSLSIELAQTINLEDFKEKFYRSLVNLKD